MNKADFLNTLKQKISTIPQNEAEKILSFYSEAIDDRADDGISEEAAVASFGDIDNLVAEILNGLPLTAIISSRVKESHAKSDNKILWMILAICGSPLWLPLLFTLIISGITFIITILLLAFALFVSLIAIMIAAAFTFIVGIIKVFAWSLLGGFLYVGIGLCAFGIGILLFTPVIYICKKLISFIGTLFKKLKSSLIKKEVN